jgi:Matrixin
VKPRVVLTCALMVAAGAISASGFSVFGNKWPAGNVVLQLQLGESSALSNGARSWGEVAEATLTDWNAAIQTVQLQVVRDSNADKGDGNRINNVFFSSDVYGMDFGANVLAVTTTWRRGGTRTEGDVIFNNGRAWDAYDGSLKRSPTDFRRVALHEFGHVLGLDHPDENGQAVSAIMNSHVSNLDRLTPDDVAGVQSMYGGSEVGGGFGGGLVSFPPRNESLDFRNQLEATYRDGLKRSGQSTSVDNEGAVVWTQEYLRYRVNLCTHSQAVDRVMTQIDGGSIQSVCGQAPDGQVRFPPRNESLDFRNALEAKYRDGLRRVPTSTSVDLEGEVVWTQEYLRYRVNGCGHATGVQSVMTEIAGRTAPPVCR